MRGFRRAVKTETQKSVGELFAQMLEGQGLAKAKLPGLDPNEIRSLFLENAAPSGSEGSKYLYPEDTGGGLFPPTTLVSSIALTRSARSYIEIWKMAETLAETTVGRISMEIHRAEAEGHPVVCVLLSPKAEKRLLSETISLDWNTVAVEGAIKTFMGYEALIEPKLGEGDYLVVTV